MYPPLQYECHTQQISESANRKQYSTTFQLFYFSQNSNKNFIIHENHNLKKNYCSVWNYGLNLGRDLSQGIILMTYEILGIPLDAVRPGVQKGSRPELTWNINFSPLLTQICLIFVKILPNFVDKIDRPVDCTLPYILFYDSHNNLKVDHLAVKRTMVTGIEPELTDVSCNF